MPLQMVTTGQDEMTCQPSCTACALNAFLEQNVAHIRVVGIHSGPSSGRSVDSLRGSGDPLGALGI